MFTTLIVAEDWKQQRWLFVSGRIPIQVCTVLLITLHCNQVPRKTIANWLWPYVDDMMLSWYRKWISTVEIRNKMKCETWPRNRMKKTWAFLVFNVQSTFCSDVPKTNCQNKEIKRTGKLQSTSVGSHFLWIIWQNSSEVECWSDSVIEFVFTAHESAGGVSNCREASWFCLLQGICCFSSARTWKESSGGFDPDPARHQELTGRFLHSWCHQRD